MSNIEKFHNTRERKENCVLVGDLVSVSALKFGLLFAKNAFPDSWETARYEAEVLHDMGKRKLLSGAQRQFRIRYITTSEIDVVFEDEITFISRPNPISQRIPSDIVTGITVHANDDIDDDQQKELGENIENSFHRNTPSEPDPTTGENTRLQLTSKKSSKVSTLSQSAISNDLPNNTRASSLPIDPTIPIFSDPNMNFPIENDYFCSSDHTPYERFKPKFLTLPNDSQLSPFELFLNMLPMKYIEDVVIPGTSKRLFSQGLAKLKKFEFLRYIGLRVAMSLFKVDHLSDFWMTEDAELKPTPDFGKYGISRDRFKRITQNLAFYIPSEAPSPTLLQQALSIYDGFNVHMKSTYSPSFCVCLDESMSKWTNRWSAPIWTYLPRKPTPFGTEVKNIADAANSIVFVMEPVYATTEKKMFEETYKKMCATILRLTLTSGLWETPRVLVGDSAFTSLEAMIALHSHKIHSVFVIKKKLSWPKDIPGEDLQLNVAKLTIYGSTYSRKGRVQDKFGHEANFYVCGLKDYIPALLLTNFGSTMPTSVETERSYYNDVGQKITSKFYRPDIYDIFYTARHSVDDSNNLRMGDRSIEDSWLTKSWITRVFAFIIGQCEANAYKAYLFNYLNDPSLDPKAKLEHVSFRRKMCIDLFKYCDRMEHRAETEMTSDRDETAAHKIMKYANSTPIIRGKSKLTSRKATQPQFYCKMCTIRSGSKSKRTCFYCVCDYNTPLCKACRDSHLLAH